LKTSIAKIILYKCAEITKVHSLFILGLCPRRLVNNLPLVLENNLLHLVVANNRLLPVENNLLLLVVSNPQLLVDNLCHQEECVFADVDVDVEVDEDVEGGVDSEDGADVDGVDYSELLA
jgi:hypothetical protein